MSAGKQNLEIEKKASFEYTFYVLNSYDKSLPPNDPGQDHVDLTGCTGAASIKDKIGGSTLISFVVTIPNPTIGQVKLALSAANTASLNFKTGVWDIFITFPSGKVEKYLEGSVTLGPNVT